MDGLFQLTHCARGSLGTKLTWAELQQLAKDQIVLEINWSAVEQGVHLTGEKDLMGGVYTIKKITN
jgi:hypothetical protein